MAELYVTEAICGRKIIIEDQRKLSKEEVVLSGTLLNS